MKEADRERRTQREQKRRGGEREGTAREAEKERGTRRRQRGRGEREENREREEERAGPCVEVRARGEPCEKLLNEPDSEEDW